jgi:hypothetical protein
MRLSRLKEGKEGEEGGEESSNIDLTESFLEFLNANSCFVRCPNEKCGFVFERVENQEIPSGITVCE